MRLLACGVVVPALAAAVSTLATLVSPGGLVGWITDLAVHWQWLWLIVACACALALALVAARRAWLSALGAATVAACWWQAAPALPEANGDGPRLKVMTANVYLGSDNLSRVVALIEREAPDVVFLQEVAESAMPQLPVKRYPYMLVRRPIESYGVVVLSKHPFRGAETVELMPELAGHRFSHRATLEWQGREIAVGAVHLAPPMSAEFVDVRDRLLQDTVHWVRERRLPALIVGDLNATPWSRPLKSAAAGGMLRATSLQPTWSASWPLLPAAIPIDQVLASDGHWAVVSRDVGPAIGSDHLPVIVTLALRGETQR